MWPRPPGWATDMGHESWSLGLVFCPWAAWGSEASCQCPAVWGGRRELFLSPVLGSRGSPP